MTDNEKPPEPPFATATALEGRWRPLSQTERDTAGLLLSDASDVIMTQCPHWQTLRAATLERVVCQMVKRAMLNMDVAGVTQNSQTAGSYTESMTYSNPDGDLYLTSSEKRSLGIGRQHAFVISMGGHE